MQRVYQGMALTMGIYPLFTASGLPTHIEQVGDGWVDGALDSCHLLPATCRRCTSKCALAGPFCKPSVFFELEPCLHLLDHHCTAQSLTEATVTSRLPSFCSCCVLIGGPTYHVREHGGNPSSEKPNFGLCFRNSGLLELFPSLVGL